MMAHSEPGCWMVGRGMQCVGVQSRGVEIRGGMVRRAAFAYGPSRAGSGRERRCHRHRVALVVFGSPTLTSGSHSIGSTVAVAVTVAMSVRMVEVMNASVR